MNYLRFSPQEFRAIRQACDPVRLSSDFLAVFKYFLIEAVHDTQPDLAKRIRRFRKPQLVLLYGFLRQQRLATAKRPARTWTAEKAGLNLEELQAVRNASGPFFLHDGDLGSFQDFLLHSLREIRPGLATKLAMFGPGQIAKLYHQVKTRTHWNM